MNEELLKYVDMQRWLMNSGLFTQSMKNQLFAYGSLVDSAVQAVELDIVIETQTLKYTIYVPTATLKLLEKYKRLSTATSFIGLWRFKRFLLKHGDLNYRNILQGFVSDFCGPKWNIDITVLDIKQYNEEQNEARKSIDQGGNRSYDIR